MHSVALLFPSLLYLIENVVFINIKFYSINSPRINQNYGTYTKFVVLLLKNTTKKKRTKINFVYSSYHWTRYYDFFFSFNPSLTSSMTCISKINKACSMNIHIYLVLMYTSVFAYISSFIYFVSNIDYQSFSFDWLHINQFVHFFLSLLYILVNSIEL